MSVIDSGRSEAHLPAEPTAGFFSRLPADLQVALIGLGRLRRYPPRTMLFLEGDQSPLVHLIRSGLVKVSVTVATREVVLDVLGEGELLGELSVVDGQPRSATATTLSPTEAVSIPGPAFMAFLSEQPGVSIELLRDVAGRLRHTYATSGRIRRTRRDRPGVPAS